MLQAIKIWIFNILYKKIKKNINKYYLESFSLLEILIVISIIAFIFTISVKFFKLSDNLLLYTEAERIYCTLIYMQNKAKIKKIDLYIKIDVNKNTYELNSDKQLNKLHKNVIFGYIKDSNGPPSNPKNKIIKPITFKNNQIVFYKDGTISSGVIYLINKNKNIMYAISTGIASISHVRIYKYENTLKIWNLLN